MIFGPLSSGFLRLASSKINGGGGFSNDEGEWGSRRLR